MRQNLPVTDETLYPHMAVPRELAEQLVETYPDAQNYPEALRRAGWHVAGEEGCGER